ncbi:MAG: oxidoreductase [Gracilibacter sp. BRH_c7a]|nr:MAG: oxidoreductase [Gracilibacter sp. BRH_c7a]
MTVNDMYTFVNESHWEAFVPIYFLLISISAGSLMVASFSTVFGLKQYQIIVRPAVFTSLVTLVLAPIFLILDLGQPLRFLYVINPFNFNVQSPMSWGGFLLILYGITLLLLAKKYIGAGSTSQTIAETAASASGRSKLLYIVAFAFAVFLSAYPGLELGVVPGKALWNTPVLPVYFITTSLLGGIGVLFLVGRFAAKQESLQDFISAAKPIAISLILLSFVWIVSRSMTLSTSGLEAEAAAQALWKSGWFLWGELVLGLIIPFALLLFGDIKKNSVLLTLTGGLLLIGVFSMRYSIVFAGLAAVLP